MNEQKQTQRIVAAEQAAIRAAERATKAADRAQALREKAVYRERKAEQKNEGRKIWTAAAFEKAVARARAAGLAVNEADRKVLKLADSLTAAQAEAVLARAKSDRLGDLARAAMKAARDAGLLDEAGLGIGL